MRSLRLGLLAFLLCAARAAAQEPDADYRHALEQGQAIWQQTRNGYRTVAWFRRAIQAKPDGSEAWRGIGVIEAMGERDEEALFHLAESLRLDPEAGLAWYWLGVVHRRAGRTRAAWDAFERATKLRLDPSQEKLRAQAGDACAALAREDAGIAERARAAAGKPGAAALVLVRYLGAAATDANMRDPGDARMRHASSVEAGKPLDSRLLRAIGWDAEGFVAALAPQFSFTGGLVAGPPPAGGAAPSRRETITVRDGAEGAGGQTTICVIGPPVALAVVASQSEVGPGQRAHLEALITDAAGNLLYFPLTRWSAAPDADARLARAESEVTRANDFEPHRNLFALPSEETKPGEVTVACVEPGTGVRGEVRLAVLAEPAKITGQSHAAGHWETDFEKALAAAARDNRVLLADFSADW